MTDTTSLRDLINDPKRVGVLATADRRGIPDVAMAPTENLLGGASPCPHRTLNEG